MVANESKNDHNYGAQGHINEAVVVYKLHSAHH